MKYKSEIFKAIHEDAMADFEVGAISDARMREFDEMCLLEGPKKTHITANPAIPQPQSHVPA